MEEGDCGNKDGRRKGRGRGIREATGWWREELQSPRAAVESFHPVSLHPAALHPAFFYS